MIVFLIADDSGTSCSRYAPMPESAQLRDAVASPKVSLIRSGTGHAPHTRPPTRREDDGLNR